MTAQSDLTRAAQTLATFDAIGHDLAVRPSPVLAARRDAIETELLEATRTDSVAQARDLIKQARPHPAAPPRKPRVAKAKQPPKKSPAPKKKPKSTPHKANYLRGQDYTRSTRRGNGGTSARGSRPTAVSSVVSGGLPGTSRQH